MLSGSIFNQAVLTNCLWLQGYAAHGKNNNIVLGDSDGVGVTLDSHETDASKKFKLFGSGIVDGKTISGVATSPDGIHWSDGKSLSFPKVVAAPGAGTVTTQAICRCAGDFWVHFLTDCGVNLGRQATLRLPPAAALGRTDKRIRPHHPHVPTPGNRPTSGNRPKLRSALLVGPSMTYQSTHSPEQVSGLAGHRAAAHPHMAGWAGGPADADAGRGR